MNSQRIYPRSQGNRWTVTAALPLLPAASDLLKMACVQTNSLTAHMSLVDQTSPDPIHFTAAGESIEVYKDFGPQFKERMARRALKLKNLA